MIAQTSMPETADVPRASERLARLQRLCERVRACEDETEPWQRGVIATEVWLNQPHAPAVRNTAEVIALCLERIPPALLPEDRFAGFVFRRLRVHQGVSDSDGWRTPAKHPERTGYDERWPLPPDVRRVYERWRGQPRPVQQRNALRAANAWLWRLAIAAPYGSVNGHTLPDYGILLTAGLAGLRERLATARTRTDAPAAQENFAAMDRILAALQAHCHACARLAAKQARAADTPARCDERMQIAADCEHLAGHAPRTFAQALQLVVLGNAVDILENAGDASSFGRLDQRLLPFYQADLTAGRLDRDEALSLVGVFLAKVWACQTSRNLCVGGLCPDGTDGTNELSYLFLEAMYTTRLPNDISVRLHENTPAPFLTLTARVLRLSLGRGGIYNDEVTVEALTRKGVAIEDARDYAPLGCVEVMIPGRSSYRTMGFGLNLVKILELVLNRGQCLVTGEQLWTDVPDTFASFADLQRAYHDKVRSVIDTGVGIIREDERREVETCPRPWLTVMSCGGLEDGRDLTAGQPRYNPVGVTLNGIADIANSLYAVRRLVFEDQTVTLDALRDILRENWAGQEPLRRRVVDGFPRFGQDASELNRIASDEAHFFAACFEPHRTWYGDRFWPMIFGVSTSIIHHDAPRTGATPAGRRLGETLAHSLQPSPAGPRGCLTEILAACTAIDLREFPGGISNVQECDPAPVAGEQGLALLESFLRAYLRMGGMELSLNFLSEEQLVDAQTHPEKYPQLMVRLFGMSARFVALSPELQASVIERVRSSLKRNPA
ncbi:MAG: hypothetical protein A3K19_03000 [Lentisphaerae bacterium RIFOXYB12_FULL_65_16]|nr:MAG: hypothetical protein A3K18_13175 [Lentisphaerae bacterium RIFOXYA12_64_32]OGV92319.1 MAG: hypothetical protein A3K19_03000 [Lentisphaerae bacterium RIFOXYB12_FULL_65_16]